MHSLLRSRGSRQSPADATCLPGNECTTKISRGGGCQGARTFCAVVREVAIIARCFADCFLPFPSPQTHPLRWPSTSILSGTSTIRVKARAFSHRAATATGDDAIILQTQIARSYGLRGDFAKAREVLKGLEPQLPAAGAEARADTRSNSVEPMRPLLIHQRHRPPTRKNRRARHTSEPMKSQSAGSWTVWP